MTRSQSRQYQRRLMDVEHTVWLSQVLETLSPGWLTGQFSQYFRSTKNPISGLRALEGKVKSFSGVRDADIKGSLASIRDREPEWLELVLSRWLEQHEALFDNPDALAAPTVDAAKRAVIEFLTQPANAGGSPALLVLVSEQSQQIADLEQRLYVQMQATIQHTAFIATLQKKLEAVHERSAMTRTKLEESFHGRLEQLVANVEQRNQLFQTERAERERLTAALECKRNELESLKTQLDAATDLLEQRPLAPTVVVQVDPSADEAQLRLINARLNADVFEKSTALSASEEGRAHLRVKLLEVSEQLDTARTAQRAAEQRVLEQRVMEQHRLQQSRRITPIIGGSLVEQALVIDYRRLSSGSSTRLAGLFSAYTAFSTGNYQHALLQSHSNIADFKNPISEVRGILVLGMEQLLLDGSNIALEPLLNLRVHRQESVLKQLLGALESPRLRAGL